MVRVQKRPWKHISKVSQDERQNMNTLPINSQCPPILLVFYMALSTMKVNHIIVEHCLSESGLYFYNQLGGHQRLFQRDERAFSF